jgi:uncharacterized protein (TIGR03118 family)
MSWGWKTITLFVLLVVLLAVLLYVLFIRKTHSKHGNSSEVRHNSRSWSFRDLFPFLPYRKKDNCSRKFKQRNIASDVNNTAHTTISNNINCWGVYVEKPKKKKHCGSVYVVNNGTSTIQKFKADKHDTLEATYVVPGPDEETPLGTPTGVALNCHPSQFLLAGSTTTIFTCTEDGFIYALVPAVDPINLQLVLDNSANNAVYKGIAITDEFLYVTNFNSGYVERYDTALGFVDQFTDDDLLNIGYAPFNVKSVCTDTVLVTFAKQDELKHDDISGPGNGYIDVFTSAGVFKQRLVDRGHLNSPWGLTVVEREHKKHLFVGNSGDGTIQVYKLRNGKFIGPAEGCDSYESSIIDGLWGIDARYESKEDKLIIYFGAGIENENHGLYGKLVGCE